MQRAYSKAGNELNRHETQAGKKLGGVALQLPKDVWKESRVKEEVHPHLKSAQKVSLRCCTVTKKQMIWIY